VLNDAAARGADIELDFGVVVGLEEAFTRTVSFSRDVQRRLLDLGVTVLVSAYPGQGRAQEITRVGVTPSTL
jgi:hypothetical protein